MALHYNALYFDLLQDLSRYLPIEAASEEDVAQLDWWPGMTLKQLQSVQLAKSFFKKLEDRSNHLADLTALDKFLQSNLRCRDWSLVLESEADSLLWGTFLTTFQSFVMKTWKDSIVPDYSEILDRGRTGPGASLGALGNDFYTKMFSSPLTCTDKGLHSLYEHYVQRNPNWREAEELRYSQFGVPRVVEGNRLSFVPKNRDASRCICTEPSLNMFYQLGIGSVIEERLSNFFGIRLSNQQEYNKILAKIGSCDDSYCTIDLSCASDSVSMGLLHKICPPELLRWIIKCRSPMVTLPDGRVEELHMVSSMGNGFTFPLQTAIFSCVVSSAYSVLGIPLDKNQHPRSPGRELGKVGNFGVFGDDIIVDPRAYRSTVRLLNMLGFLVNEEKSFKEGRFRESCGGDYFDGQPARGVYIKTLRTPASRYVAINRLNEWSALTGIPLTRTIRRLVRTVRFIPVPLAENDDAGIKVPFSYLESRHFKRKDSLKRVNYGSIVYRVWAALPKVLRLPEGEIVPPKGARKRFYNAPGLLEAFLRGDIEGGTMSIRLGAPRYTSKVAVTPNWDRLPTVGTHVPIGQARLATAILVNLPG